MGSQGEEGNRFYELTSWLDADAFVLNTGSIGADGPEIRVKDTITLLLEVARETIEWTTEETLELVVPESVPGMDVDRFHVPRLVTDFQPRYEVLQDDRQRYLESFPDLNPSIKSAVY